MAGWLANLAGLSMGNAVCNVQKSSQAQGAMADIYKFIQCGTSRAHRIVSGNCFFRRSLSERKAFRGLGRFSMSLELRQAASICRRELVTDVNQFGFEIKV